MKDLFEWKVRGVPVDWVDRFFLWEKLSNGEIWQAVLVIEEGCARIYSYQYEDDDEETDFRKFCWDYFYDFSGTLRIDTLWYIELEFDDINNLSMIIKDICDLSLTDCRYSGMLDFLIQHRQELSPTMKAYAYYK